MSSPRTIFGDGALRRAAALLACIVLLYFAAGGAFLHEHKDGPDTACHVCQALHMPALASTRLELGCCPGMVARLFPLRHSEAPSDSLTLHRAGRAPPAV